MKHNRALNLGTLLLILSAVAALSFPQAPRSGNGENARGQYLVEEVARCWECHTPMMGQGKWDQSKWLQGAPVWFRPIEPITEWAYSAPRIAGLPSFTDEQARTILEKGVGPNGLAIRLPMHTYHLSPEDSASIIAYLHSQGWKR